MPPPQLVLSLLGQELPLYCSGGLRFFWDNKFDHAMVAFLDCVQQFKEEVEKGETRFCLPYRSVFLNAECTWSGTKLSRIEGTVRMEANSVNGGKAGNAAKSHDTDGQRWIQHSEQDRM